MGSGGYRRDPVRLHLFLDHQAYRVGGQYAGTAGSRHRGGVGCSLACLVSDQLSKDRTYVNVIMSDNLEAMQAFRDFLAEYHITNVAADTYTLDWNTKPITLPAYPETKAESRLITRYIEESPLKFKRLVQPG